jgi:hypothetical protein
MSRRVALAFVVVLLCARAVAAQTPVVSKAVDDTTKATTEIGDATNHGLRTSIWFSGSNIDPRDIGDRIGRQIGRMVLISSSNTEIATASNPLRVDPTGTTTQPVSISGTLPAYATTPTFNLGTLNGAATDATVANPQFTAGTTTAPGKATLVGGKTSDGTPQYQPLPLTAGGAAVKTDASATTQPISASALPLPSGAATSAKQPALGTAGSAATDVLSVQGIASMTALKVDGSGVTQPVSGTFFQATQPVSGTFWPTAAGSPSSARLSDGTSFYDARARSWTLSSGTDTVALGGTLPAFAATPTVNLGTLNGAALDTTVTGRLPAGGSPANGESNTNTSLSRIGGYNFIYNGSTWDRWTGAVTGSGNFTVVQPTGSNLHIQCDAGCGGASAFNDNSAFTAGTTAVGNIGAVFNDGLSDVTSGNAAAPRITAKRGVHTNLRTNAGVEVPFPAALGANGGFKIEGVASGTAVPVSGTVSVSTIANGTVTVQGDQSIPLAQSLGGTLLVAPQSTPWASSVTDGTNTATVKAASTAAVASDKALVVAVSPTTPVNQGTAAAATGGWPVVNGIVSQTSGSVSSGASLSASGVSGMGSALVTIAANAGGASTFTFEGSVDGATFFPLPYHFRTAAGWTIGGSSTTLALSVSDTAQAVINLPGGVTDFRARRTDANAGSNAVVIAPSVEAYSIQTNPTVTQGTATSAAGAWTMKVTDGTNTAAVKAASTAAAATDPALVVSLSPNSPLPTGSNTIGALSANQSVNQTQVNGVAVSTGLGVSDTGTQRMALSQEATYAASTTAKTATASGTAAFFEICGSASKTVRIQRIAISGTWATAGYGDIQIRKVSAAGTGGTATTLTNTPFDSNSAAATATAKYFTVLPTGGDTLVGNIFSETAFFPLTGTVTTFQTQFIYVWRDTDAEPPTLRGTAQCITAGFGTAPGVVPTLSVSVAWTEK